MNTTRLRIDGMNCLACLVHIEKALQAVPGVKDVSVDLDTGATVEHNGIDEKLLIRAVNASGSYKAEVVK